MTPSEFRVAIERMKISQLAAARLLGIDGRTCRRYIRGDLKIPPPIARLLAYIEAYGPEVAMEMATAEAVQERERKEKV